jgi:hypothetical protein
MNYYYTTPVDRKTCIGRSLTLFNVNFVSLDSNLFSLSSLERMEMDFLSSSFIATSAFISPKITYLGTELVTVSSTIYTELVSLHVSSINFPNNIVPVFTFNHADSIYLNFDSCLVANGTGATLAQAPRALIPEGNKRGQYATEWQKNRSLSEQVAKGNYTVVMGGSNNTAFGHYSIVHGGFINYTNGDYSTVGGGYSANTIGKYSTIVGGYANITNRDYNIVTAGKSNSAFGLYSSIGGGLKNFIKEDGTSFDTTRNIGGGTLNTIISAASGSCIPGGSSGLTYMAGQYVNTNGSFNSIGDSQHSTFILRGITLNNTVNLSPSDNTQFYPPLFRRHWVMNLRVVGVAENGSACASYEVAYEVNVDASGYMSSIPTTPVNPSSNGTNLLLSISRNPAPAYLVQVGVTTGGGLKWYWTAHVDTMDMAF